MKIIINIVFLIYSFSGFSMVSDSTETLLITRCDSSLSNQYIAVNTNGDTSFLFNWTIENDSFFIEINETHNAKSYIGDLELLNGYNTFSYYDLLNSNLLDSNAVNIANQVFPSFMIELHKIESLGPEVYKLTHYLIDRTPHSGPGRVREIFFSLESGPFLIIDKWLHTMIKSEFIYEW
jgi:hypothetical protein